jgi:hypothetical protein
MRPRGVPIDQLATALAALAREENPEVFGDLHLSSIAMRFRAGLRRSSDGLVDALVEAVPNAAAPILIVVDQFEELFRYESRVEDPVEAFPLYRDEAQGFSTLILTAIGSTRRDVFVLLTMRSDFIGECGRYPGLAEIVSASQYLVPTMTREQFRQAIVGPLCSEAGLPIDDWSETIEPALLPRLLNAASDERAMDPLPVLQHTLMRTWQVAARRTDDDSRVVLTQGDYREIGEIDGALSLHADEVMARAVHEISLAAGNVKLDAERLLEHMFRALTVDAEGRAVRRPRTLLQLAEVAGLSVASREQQPTEQDSIDPPRLTEESKRILLSAIDPFRAAGVNFLTPFVPSEIGEATPIDVSHEALIRRWDRIASTARDSDGSPAGWLAREIEDGFLWRSLLVQAGYEQSHLSAAVTRRVTRWFETLPAKEWTYRYFIPGAGRPSIPAAADTPSAAYERVRIMLERSRGVQAEEERRLKEADARARERRRREYLRP